MNYQSFNDGQSFIKNQIQKKINKNKAKNVIVIVGDGYGITTNYINRLNQGHTKALAIMNTDVMFLVLFK